MLDLLKLVLMAFGLVFIAILTVIFLVNLIASTIETNDHEDFED